MCTHEDELNQKCFFYIVTFRLFLKNKVGKILFGEFFDNFKTIISLALVK